MEFEEVLRSDRKENIPIAYFLVEGGCNPFTSKLDSL